MRRSLPRAERQRGMDEMSKKFRERADVDDDQSPLLTQSRHSYSTMARILDPAKVHWLGFASTPSTPDL